MKKWLCVICGLIYDEALGWPSDGVPPGTRWEDVPDDWLCPDCGVGKADFEMIVLEDDEEEPAATVAPAEPLRISSAQANASAQPAQSQPGQGQHDNGPLVIVGSGYAGYSLAEEIRRHDKVRPIHLFTRDDGRNYSKPALSTGLARGKGPDDLVSETALELAERLDIRIHALCPVETIDPTNKTLHTALGPQRYGQLVLATGASPIKLSFAGDGGDVISINDLQDYRAFREQLPGKTRVALIGNGLIGCEFANDLLEGGYGVTTVGLTDWPMDGLIPEAAGKRLQQALEERGAAWHLGTTVEQIDRQENGYRLRLANGRIITADLVVSAVGLAPNTALARTGGLTCNRGIAVDEFLRTSDADIYALGDCAEIGGQLLPYIAPITHGVKPLAQTLLGRPSPVAFPPMPVSVKTPAHPVTVLPPAHREGDWLVTETSGGVRALFYDRQNRLIGFALTGEHIQERQRWQERCALNIAA